MILLVEGVDKTGKSTLVEGIRQKLRWPIFKFSQQPDAQTAVHTCLKGLNAARHFTHVIFDRFPHPDDLIYAPIIEGTSPSREILDFHKNEIETAMLQQSVRLIYCEASIETIEARMAEAKGFDVDDYVLPSHITAIIKGYEQFLDKTRLPVCRLDSSKMTPEEMVREAINFMGAGIECNLR